MVKSLTQALSLGALLTLATACSRQPLPAPGPGAQVRSADNVRPDPGTDPPPGGGSDCTPAAPSSVVKDRIRKEARLICAGNGWTIITTTTPPDGFTFGLGCVTSPYPFSVDVRVRNDDGTYRYTYASGTYDENSGTTTLSL